MRRDSAKASRTANQQTRRPAREQAKAKGLPQESLADEVMRCQQWMGGSCGTITNDVQQRGCRLNNTLPQRLLPANRADNVIVNRPGAVKVVGDHVGGLAKTMSPRPTLVHRRLRPPVLNLDNVVRSSECHALLDRLTANQHIVASSLKISDDVPAA
jgi:hypothetical protein